MMDNIIESECIRTLNSIVEELKTNRAQVQSYAMTYTDEDNLPLDTPLRSFDVTTPDGARVHIEVRP